MILLATDDGLIACQAVSWQIAWRSLPGKNVTSLAAREGSILAGTDNGIYHSEDGGQTWQESHGITHPHIRWLALHPAEPRLALAGTEPAGIFSSTDLGQTWRGVREVEDLRDRHHWFLPYSPEAGCVRGFAFHGDRAYAAVEVGGALRSDDRGTTWRLAGGSTGDPQMNGVREPHIHPDVHSIQVHPASPDLVYAPTGGGFYRSFDGGETWRCLYDCYCRAVWTDPRDPEHIILGPADNVDRNGRIEESRDGGKSWHLSSANLTVPWPRHMVERFTQAGDMLLAVLSNGELASAPLEGLSWSMALPDVAGINAAVEI